MGTAGVSVQVRAFRKPAPCTAIYPQRLLAGLFPQLYMLSSMVHSQNSPQPPAAVVFPLAVQGTAHLRPAIGVLTPLLPVTPVPL